MRSSRNAPTVAQLVLRVAAGLLGGYAFTWGFVVLGVASLVAFDVGFHDAEHGMLMLAWLVFLVAFLWAFAARSMGVVWAALAGGGALMAAGAWVVQRSVLA